MLSPDLADWLHATIGPCTLEYAYRPMSGHTGVWRVRGESGWHVVKQHATYAAGAREVFAYRHWTRAYAPYAPELVAVNEECRALLLTHRDGLPFRMTHLAPATALAVFERAGELARRVRDLATGPGFGDPTAETVADPVAFMTARLERAYRQAVDDDLLDRHERELAEWALAHGDIYAGEPPVPVNTDFTPKNWLVDADGALAAVLDFEHMRWGVAVETFGPLWVRHFPVLPGSEDAFCTGYGERPDPDQTRHARVTAGVTAIAWGAAHARDDWAGVGRALLKRL